jgi:hypothetical protein
MGLLPAACDTAIDIDARDSALAFQLKITGVVSIFVAGLLGVSIPFIGKGLRFLSSESNVFFVSRAFAAGVILATGFVHILPEGVEALQNPCLPDVFLNFPFVGFMAMMSALTTLLVDNICTGYYEDLHSHQKQKRYIGRSERQPLLGSKSAPPTEAKMDKRFLREKSLLRLGSHAAEVLVSVKKLASENLYGKNQIQEIEAVGDPHHLTEQEEAHIRNIVITQVR